MSIDRDVIKNLEEALKVVDDSDLPSAPGSDRPFPILPVRSDADSPSPQTDKYGIPIAPKSGNAPKKPLPDKLDSLDSIDFSDNMDFTDNIILPSKDTSPDYDDLSDDMIPPKKLDRSENPAPPDKSGRFKVPVISKLRKVVPKGVAGKPKNTGPYVIPGGFSSDGKNEYGDGLDIGPPDFKMKFDFESAYRDVPERKPLRLRREKRTGLVGGLLFAIFVICISLILASIAWMATADILGFASVDEEVSVQVPQGFSIDGITDMLYEAGLIRYKYLFNIYAEYSNAEEKISEGTYILNRNFDYRAIVQGMTARAGVRVETSVTIPEGYTMAQIFALLEAEGVCPANELWEVATYHDFTGFHFLERKTLGDKLRLEGFLFPDTYNFYMDSTAQQAILRMLREFHRRFTEEYIERAEEMDLSIREIVTIASLIEREAGDDEERPRIAAVIYNRLNNPDYPRLEIDATIHYAIAGTTIPFSTQLESVYNTYIHEGLPPGPIASPGMPSIHAALFPDTTGDYYYALNRFGTHNFFTNYNDHVNFVNSDEYGG